MPAVTQPDLSCLTDASHHQIATHGISNFGDDVRSTDGTNHTVTGTVSLRVHEQPEQHPTRFTVHATPSSGTRGGVVGAELHGIRYVGRRVRAVVRTCGHRYSWCYWSCTGAGAQDDAAHRAMPNWIPAVRP